MKDLQTKPKIHINFDSPDGNIFTVLAHAANAMKAYGIIDAKEKAAKMRERVTSSHGYEDALDIIREYVDIIEE